LNRRLSKPQSGSHTCGDGINFALPGIEPGHSSPQLVTILTELLLLYSHNSNNIQLGTKKYLLYINTDVNFSAGIAFPAEARTSLFPNGSEIRTTPTSQSAAAA
jgi:hypothetical protein